MNDLIEALQIFARYVDNPTYPTQCEHDMLYVPKPAYDDVSDEDLKRLDELGFQPSEMGGFQSFRFGST